MVAASAATVAAVPTVAAFAAEGAEGVRATAAWAWVEAAATVWARAREARVAAH